jgi:hypothetical protein
LDAKLLRFEHVNDSDFINVFNACENSASRKVYRLDGYLFLKNRLRVSNSFMRQFLVREAHWGNLMGHFGVAKTLDILYEHFY